MKTTSTRPMAPAVKTLAALAVLAAGVSGCASRATASGAAGAGAPNSTAPAVATPAAPTSSAGGTTSPGAQPTTSGAPAAPTKMPGAMQTTPIAGGYVKTYSPEGLSLAADGKTLSVPIEWGGCSDKPEIAVVSQDSATVSVAMKEVSHAGAGKMCPNHTQLGTATLTLNAPLGTRTLVDAVTGTPIPVH